MQKKLKVTGFNKGVKTIERVAKPKTIKTAVNGYYLTELNIEFSISNLKDIDELISVLNSVRPSFMAP